MGESGKMNCLTQEELKLYKAGLVEEKLWQEITEHLYRCEQCSEVFLTLLSSEEIRQAEDLLSSDFTMKVKTALREENCNLHKNKVIDMNLDAGKKKNYSRKRCNEKRQSLLFYYVGAAVVTLIFMSGGVFQKVIDIPPLIASATEIERKGMAGIEDFRFNLPDRVLDKADFWIENLEVKVKGGFHNEEKK
jgi:hypothetical protein